MSFRYELNKSALLQVSRNGWTTPTIRFETAPVGGLSFCLLDWIFTFFFFLLNFCTVHLAVLWEGRLWGWARLAPHELAWTTVNLPRTSSKNDLAVSLPVLGWHTSLQIYPLLSPSTCVIFEWGISWVTSKAVLELHLKYAVVYCFHSQRMGSYKYWHVCFLFLSFIICIEIMNLSGPQFTWGVATLQMCIEEFKLTVTTEKRVVHGRFEL